MKLSTTKKLFAFIIKATMFSVTPALVNAQLHPHKKCHGCAKGCECFFGYCMCPWPPFLTNSSPSNEDVSISPANSNAISFQLEEAQNVSGKIYDATGRLVKTIVNSMMSEGYHEVEWDSKDNAGKAVPAGVYVLHVVTNSKSQTKKLPIMN